MIRVGFPCLVAVAAMIGNGLCLMDEPQAKEATSPTEKAREADREAIRQSAKAFIAAFEKGDAKAIAALWTEEGEYESEDGTILRGRQEIEAAFAEHFKARPGSKMEIKAEEIRFPSRDSAVEEGLSRTTTGSTLPESSFYRTVHVREDGKWRIALSREWGEADNRMSDLDWLVGTWRGSNKEQEMSITFARDKQGPFLLGEFHVTAAGKPVPVGTMKIGIDPGTGQFMSWHFDPDGGFGHGTWIREGNNWVVDSGGRQADGAEIASVNILTRFGSDELGWRSIDRLAGGRPLPDSAPIRLKRNAATK